MTVVPPRPTAAPGDPFVGGGSMAELMREVDWSTTPLGPVAAWPQSLRTAVSILNDSGFPMYIAWGPDYVQFYNDAYRPILGSTKHPAAMGQSTRVCFAEIWDFIGPMFERVLREGEQTYLEDQLLELDRNGFVEECYFTFSYSPIRDETGQVGGVYVTVIETTGRVLGERRLRVLRDLADAGSGATTAAEAASREADVLAGELRDLPFALVYLLDDDADALTLAGSSGIDSGSPLAPTSIQLGGGEDLPWRVGDVIAERAVVEIDGLVEVTLSATPRPEPVGRAMALPISRPGQEQPAGVLVAGISPRLALDDDYRSFLHLIAGQVANAIADSRAYEDERRRAEALAALALTEQVRASELRAVLEAMDEGVIVVDAGGGVFLRNAAAVELLGGSVDSVDDVFAAFSWDADDRPLEDARRASIERRLTGTEDRWGDLRIHPVGGEMGGAAGPLGSIFIVRDVTEERRQRTLREAFIGVLSHELRTPITTIYAGSKLLTRTRPGSSEVETDPEVGDARGRGLDEERGSILADIAAEADRLYRLVEDLLVLARFERGATHVPGEPVLLQRILTASLRSESARWPETRFEVDIAPNLPAVSADPTYAEQIARNLLANAAKYGDVGTRVTLTAEHVGDEVLVRVFDEGPGIDAGEADRLFELFYRSPAAVKKPGAGIGLFVARRLADSMGGRTWARPLPARGSEFGFALPVHEDE
ncbi:MAG: ATP-binding protein [Candidatus Limnocylindrales bacterium]